jgi:hypothetical protein
MSENWIDADKESPAAGELTFCKGLEKIEGKPLIFLAIYHKENEWIFYSFRNIFQEVLILGSGYEDGYVCTVTHWLKVET